MLNASQAHPQALFQIDDVPVKQVSRWRSLCRHNSPSVADLRGVNTQITAVAAVVHMKIDPMFNEYQLEDGTGRIRACQFDLRCTPDDPDGTEGITYVPLLPRPSSLFMLLAN